MKKTLLILTLAALVLLASCSGESGLLKKRENCGPFGDLSFVAPLEACEAIFYDTEESAKNAGVPTGFKGSVVGISGKESSGFTMDYTDNKTAAGTIETFTVRLFAPAEARKLWVRCGTNKICEFVIHSNERGKWNDFTANVSGENIRTGHSFEQFGNADGYMTTFDVYVDFVARESATAYVDSVTYTLKDYADSVPPKITYKGSTNIDMTAGKPLVIEKISAYDVSDAREVKIEYEWENPEATDENGFPKEGKYKYYAIARDMDLNESRIEFNVNVRPRDTEAPVINLDKNEITISKDSVFDMHFTATDNEDGTIICTADFESKGVLDFGGRVTEGTHLLTIKASDFSGNTAEKTITVISK